MAYSTRSWASTPPAHCFAIASIRCMRSSSVLRRRRRRELVGDALKDRLHAGASCGHGTNGDQRDQRDEQRVLEQVLAFGFTNERTEKVQTHLILLQVIGLRRGGRRRELVGDALENRLDAGPRRRDRADRDERDQRHEQRVLEQILTVGITNELAKKKCERHVVPPARALRASVVRNAITW